MNEVLPVTLDEAADLLNVARRTVADACDELDITPAFRTYEGEAKDMRAFVINLNIGRRHLDASQRSLLAAKVANAKVGNQTLSNSLNLDDCTADQAASLFNVSRAQVFKAKELLLTGTPELIKAVESGQETINGALKKLAQASRPGPNPEVTRRMELDMVSRWWGAVLYVDSWFLVHGVGVSLACGLRVV